MYGSLAALIVVCLLTGGLAAGEASTSWRSLYADGSWDADARGIASGDTHSQRTPVRSLATAGLLVADPSTAGASLRYYWLDWHADPARGAAVEARLKVTSCSAPWGVFLMVADGVHEEAITFFPDRLELANAHLVAPFDAAGAFHTYRVEIKGADLRVFADDQLLLDATGKFTSPSEVKPPRNQCAFGAGSSPATGEAVWEFVRCTGAAPAPAKPSPPRIPGVRLTVGQPFLIRDGGAYPGLFKFRDGSLAQGPRRSTDGGHTWTNAPSVGTNALELPNGELITYGQETFLTHKAADGVFTLEYGRSSDGGKTFTQHTARFNLPDATGGTDDGGKPFEGPGLDHGLVQLRDGSLLATMYGYFKTDTVLSPAYPPEWKVYKYRNFVVRSTDQGRTWDFLATVAYDPAIGCESFCEADLLQLPRGQEPHGDILCFMRTGGPSPQWATPLYLSRSRDEGKTWSKPVAIADRGVWPNSCRMASGIIALVYGRADNYLQLSLDGGKTWAGRMLLSSGDYSVTTSYNTVEEVAPDTLLVTYDTRALDADGNAPRRTFGVFIQIKRR